MSDEAWIAAADAACEAVSRDRSGRYSRHRIGPAQRGAFRKGYAARLADLPRVDPYPDHRTGYHNGVTFSAGFSRYWLDGWDAADKAGDGAA